MQANTNNDQAQVAAIPSSQFLNRQPRRLREAIQASGARENGLISIVFAGDALPTPQTHLRNRSELAQYGVVEPFVAKWRRVRNENNLIELRPTTSVFPSTIIYDGDTMVQEVVSYDFKTLSDELRHSGAQARDLVSFQLDFTTPFAAGNDIITLSRQQPYAAYVVDGEPTGDWMSLQLTGVSNKTISVARFTPVSFVVTKQKHSVSPALAGLAHVLHVLTGLLSLAAGIVLFSYFDQVHSNKVKYAAILAMGMVTAFLHSLGLWYRRSRARARPWVINHSILVLSLLVLGGLIMSFVDAIGLLSEGRFDPMQDQQEAFWIMILILMPMYLVSTIVYYLVVRSVRRRGFYGLSPFGRAAGCDDERREVDDWRHASNYRGAEQARLNY